MIDKLGNYINARIFRRASISIFIFVLLLGLYGYIYMISMRLFEGISIPYYVALQGATEAVTTAGFGGHAPWESLEMNLIIVFMNLTGVLIFFIGIPLVFAPVVIPYFKEVLKREPSKKCSLTEHIIITGFSDMDAVLVRELEENGIPFVFLVDEKEDALNVESEGYPVVWGDFDTVNAFDRANISEARSVLIDVDEDLIPSIVLTAEKASGNPDIITVSSRENSSSYHRLAGADDVFNPKYELGRSLGLRSVVDVSDEIESVIEDNRIEISNMIIHEDSEFLHCTISEVQSKLESPIVAGWFNGKFVAAPNGSIVVSENSILLVAQYNPNFTSTESSSNGHVVIAGLGSVGSAVKSTVEEAGFEVRTIDISNPNADVVGDVKNVSNLKKLDIDSARTLIMAIEEDNDAIYTSLITNRIAPDTDIITRVNEKRNVWKLYEAGADFVLPLETLTADYLASQLIYDVGFISPTEQIAVDTISNPEYEGLKVIETNIREEFGYIIIAIKRDGEYLFEVTGDTQIKKGDSLIIIGEEVEKQIDTYIDTKNNI